MRHPLSQPVEQPVAPSLPIRKVQLYEIGVGYFERSGQLEPGKNVLSLPASHVDDALKTMVILADGAKLTVSAVEFESVLSEALARVQAGLPSDKSQLTYTALLSSLRGAQIEVLKRDGTRKTGRLVEVTEVIPAKMAPKPEGELGATESTHNDDGDGGAPERTEANPSGQVPAITKAHERGGPRYVVTVVEANGAILRFDSTQLESLRPLEPAVAKRLDSAVATASDRSAMSPRSIKISAATGVPIRVGYVTETPVWRVTYRLLLGKSEAETLLQGWVLVHNDTDEPWRNVALEIINGKPNSFLYPMTAPRYLRRPLNTPEEEMSTLPQLARRTPDQIWGDREGLGEADSDEGGESRGSGGLGLSGIGEGGGGRGEGIGFGQAAAPTGSGELTAGNLAALAHSEALPSGANFRYRIGQPVTLSSHSSALVPFTQLPMKAELLTRFGWGSDVGRVSVQITNSSGNTLPAGPITVFNADGLAGESNLLRLQSGRSTWLYYGTDLDTEIEPPKSVAAYARTQLLRFKENLGLVEHYVRHREAEMRIINRSALKRQLCLELPVGSNTKVTGADQLKYDPNTLQPLAIFDIAAQSEQIRKIVMDEALESGIQIDELTGEKLGKLMGAKELDAKARAILADASQYVTKRDELQRKVVDLNRRARQLGGELDRLNSMLTQAKGTEGNAAAPLARRIVELEALRSRYSVEAEAFHTRKATFTPALTKVLERLNAIEGPTSTH